VRAIGLDIARDIVVIFPLDAITSATDTLDKKESMLVEPSFAAVLAQGRKVFLLEDKPTAAVVKQETEDVRKTSSRIKAAEAHVRATRAEEKKLESLKKEQSKVEAEIRNAKKRQKETKDSNKLVSDAALKKQKAEHADLQEELKRLKKEKAEAAVRPQLGLGAPLGPGAVFAPPLSTRVTVIPPGITRVTALERVSLFLLASLPLFTSRPLPP